MLRTRLLISSTALTSTIAYLIPGAAQAQSTAVDWQGFYFGGAVGAGQSRDEIEFRFPEGGEEDLDFYYEGNALTNGGLVTGATFPTLFTLDDAYAVGTLGVGFNAQIESFVFGLETDISMFRNPSPGHETFRAVEDGEQDAYTVSTLSAEAALKNLLTLRGRAGVSIDHFLFYGTAGLAAGEGSVLTSSSVLTDTGKGAISSGEATGPLYGFVAGAGAEYAATRHLSLKLEALAYRLDGLTVEATGAGAGDAEGDSVEPYEADYLAQGLLVRGGLNFRF